MNERLAAKVVRALRSKGELELAEEVLAAFENSAIASYYAGKMPHPLDPVFADVLKQLTSGKGDERHGNGLRFDKQPWVDLACTHGVGFLTGQAAKKLREAQRMDRDAWRREMLGAIAYSAMAVLFADGGVTSPAEQPTNGSEGGL